MLNIIHQYHYFAKLSCKSIQNRNTKLLVRPHPPDSIDQAAFVSFFFFLFFGRSTIERAIAKKKSRRDPAWRGK